MPPPQVVQVCVSGFAHDIKHRLKPNFGFVAADRTGKQLTSI